MCVIAENPWTIATTAYAMVLKYLHLQAGVQVYLINHTNKGKQPTFQDILNDKIYILQTCHKYSQTV